MKRQRIPAGDRDWGNNERFRYFTEPARKAMWLATNEVQRLGQDYIGTEHLLLGIIGEGEGLAVRILRDMGINLQELHAKTLELMNVSEPATNLAPAESSETDEKEG